MSEKATKVPSGQDAPDGGRTRGRLYRYMHAHPALSLTTKVVVTTVGVAVLVAGLIMMVTPGPGIVGIVVGLAILATEWDWADRWLKAARRKAHEARMKAEQMDPRVRRRRLLITGLVLLVLVAALAGYVAAYGWPGPAIDGWDWVQSLGSWVPELPGM